MQPRLQKATGVFGCAVRTARPGAFAADRPVGGTKSGGGGLAGNPRRRSAAQPASMETAMHAKLLGAAAALALAAGALAASAQPAAARNWHSHGRGFGWGAGAIAAGIVGGAIAAGTAPYWAPGYYGAPGYAYGPGYGPYGYGPGPYSYGPGPYEDGPVASDEGLASGPLVAQGGPGDDVAYCQAHFRSYDPSSGTYLGYDGMRHPCP
jgi:hypothetical protein